MTDVVLQLRSELVEEIEMAETFGEITLVPFKFLSLVL